MERCDRRWRQQEKFPSRSARARSTPRNGTDWRTPRRGQVPSTGCAASSLIGHPPPCWPSARVVAKGLAAARRSARQALSADRHTVNGLAPPLAAWPRLRRFRRPAAAPHRAVLAVPADTRREDARLDGGEALGGQAVEADVGRRVAGGPVAVELGLPRRRQHVEAEAEVGLVSEAVRGRRGAIDRELWIESWSEASTWRSEYFRAEVLRSTTTRRPSVSRSTRSRVPTRSRSSTAPVAWSTSGMDRRPP